LKELETAIIFTEKLIPKIIGRFIKLIYLLDQKSFIVIQYSLYNSNLSKMIELSQIHTIIIEGTTLRFNEISVVIISLLNVIQSSIFIDEKNMV
jgi:hypothetical protein